MRLFWERGYEGIGVAELATAMGVNPPSLYAAFGDKRRLFLEAADLYQARYGEFIGTALTEAPSAKAAVKQILTQAADMYTRRDCPAGCMVVLAASHCAPGAMEVAVDMAARRKAGRDALRDRLSAALRSGELSPDADPDELADFFTAVLHGFSIAARDGATAAALMRAAERAMLAWPDEREASG